MSSEQQRCKYEVLGLRNDCTAEEIRSAYKNLALQRHPDKLVQSGLTDVEATALFQELVSAYKVLSDPKERAWYDSHRFEILYSDDGHHHPNSYSECVVPDLSPYRSTSVFSDYTDDSARGFYKVYSDLFEKVHANELNFAIKLGLGCIDEAPTMGNMASSYSQVMAFYSYWSVFSTVMDYDWLNKHDTKAEELNRKWRKVMEEENRKMRNNARREYNKTVRQLVAFVKKMDKRVIHIQVLKRVETDQKIKRATMAASVASEDLVLKKSSREDTDRLESRRRRDEERRERRRNRRRWDICFAGSSSSLMTMTYILLGLITCITYLYYCNTES